MNLKCWKESIEHILRVADYTLLWFSPNLGAPIYLVNSLQLEQTSKQQVSLRSYWVLDYRTFPQAWIGLVYGNLRGRLQNLLHFWTLFCGSYLDLSFMRVCCRLVSSVLPKPLMQGLDLNSQPWCKIYHDSWKPGFPQQSLLVNAGHNCLMSHISSISNILVLSYNLERG